MVVIVAWPSLSSLASNFGLSPLLNKKLAILPDARLSGRTDQAVIIERLLSISGEDHLVIDRKHAAPLAGVKMDCRLLMLTNELPNLTDASGALSSRFIPLRMVKTFYGNEDTGLLDRLKKELPGILLWALKGWEMLRQFNKFLLPESSTDVMEDFNRLTSPVMSFVYDYCELGAELSVEKNYLYKRFGDWCEEQGFTRTKTKNVFFRDLNAAVPGIICGRPMTNGNRINTIMGIDLKPEFKYAGAQ